MTNHFTKSVLAIILIGCLSGCASIIHGTKQTVDFTSQPTGAHIFIDGTDHGVTPQSISLKRRGRLPGEVKGKKEYQVKIELAGFYPYEIKIKREMDGWFIGNILFGGVIGIIVDASNGAMYKLSPNQIVAQMGKASATNYKGKDQSILIAATLKADPSWRRIGTMIKLNK